MRTTDRLSRPQTLAEVATASKSQEQFGRSLRDWQHEIQRGGVHSRKAFAASIAEPPDLLQKRFAGGDVADAYLAAYAEWLADRACVPRPPWCADRRRVAKRPWFATPLRGRLLAAAPASFRQRQLFTIPEQVFTPRRGRPRVPEEQKRVAARRRQKAYRERIRELVREAREQRSTETIRASRPFRI